MGADNGSTGKTNYAVLVLAEKEDPDVDVESWEYLGTVEASNPAKAKQHFAEKLEREGEYVAVPARNWASEPVTLERNPRAVVGKR